ncbi:hypothetical protein FQA47_003760 [Oryzias melastigma]|uniref:Uncharacterized protein n=1 Tax=Oryzias melastigma TaxID=30732 RepID=A0A834F7R7_ORYME|nr:hypothetical protein FQA47_003760 [Oryzias melastigma]
MEGHRHSNFIHFSHRHLCLNCRNQSSQPSSKDNESQQLRSSWTSQLHSNSDADLCCWCTVRAQAPPTPETSCEVSFTSRASDHHGLPQILTAALLQTLPDLWRSRRRPQCSRTTVHRLLEELKATTAEQDRLAEHVSLEQSSSPPQVRLEPSSPSAERAEVLGLQGELESAQARLQQLQEDLGELRRALQDTQSQLKDVQAENALLKTDLDFHKQQLLDGERVNRELASLAQLRLEEMEKLQSLLQSAADTPTDRIKGFLRSLSQAEPTPTEHVQERRSPPPGDAFPQSDRENPHLQACARRARSPSLCDSASLWSAWSARSSSTFDTRDEAAFRDGLAALDASIASLQRTFQLDLRRC